MPRRPDYADESAGNPRMLGRSGGGSFLVPVTGRVEQRPGPGQRIVPPDNVHRPYPEPSTLGHESPWGDLGRGDVQRRIHADGDPEILAVSKQKPNERGSRCGWAFHPEPGQDDVARSASDFDKHRLQERLEVRCPRLV